MAEAKEYEPTQEEQVKLAKIKLGADLKTTFEVDYVDPSSATGDAIHIEIELHNQTIKDDLKSTIMQEKLLEGLKGNNDLVFMSRIISLLHVLVDKIFLTIDGEKFLYPKGFWDLIQTPQFDIAKAYQDIVLPCWGAYQKFVSEQKMDFASLKKSLLREKNK
jgi:hypothetical protein